MSASIISTTDVRSEDMAKRDTVRDTITLTRHAAERLRDITVHEKYHGHPHVTKGEIVERALALLEDEIAGRDGIDRIAPRGNIDLRYGPRDG
jgi:hypothetical protein